MKRTILAVLLALGILLPNSGCATMLLTSDASSNLNHPDGNVVRAALGCGEMAAVPVAVAADIALAPVEVVGVGILLGTLRR
jgi:hypothetical protein